jgi:hypothetical protein
MFKLKDKSTLFGINKEASTDSTPVFEKNLEPGIEAEANRDGTIFVKKGMSQKKINDAVAHEKVHLEQISQGRLNYDQNTVTWKKDTRSPARVYTRQSMAEGAKNLPWEKEAYQRTKK